MASIKWVENLYEYEHGIYKVGTRQEISELTGTTLRNVSNICRVIGYRYRLIKLVHTRTGEKKVGTIYDLSDELNMSESAIMKAYRRNGTLQRGTWKMTLLDEMETEYTKQPKYKSEEEAMIQMRSFNDKHKHAPTTLKENREAIQVLKSKPVKPAKWQASPYTRQLFYKCFKGWA